MAEINFGNYFVSFTKTFEGMFDTIINITPSISFMQSCDYLFLFLFGMTCLG